MDDRHRKEAGIAGEDAALKYLQLKGLKLVARNYRCRAGEIDLVMLDGPALALIEVRYRTGTAYGGAAGSVTYRKQRRIIKAAQYLLMMRADLRRYPARFDVIAVTPATDELDVQWIKGAFAAYGN